MALIAYKQTDQDVKACPFCGADRRFIWVQNTEEAITNPKRGVYLACLRCKAYGPDRIDVEKAIESWNNRS